MKIKRVHLYSDKELQELISDIDYCIQKIGVKDTVTATWTLTRIKENLSKNLEVKDL